MMTPCSRLLAFCVIMLVNAGRNPAPPIEVKPNTQSELTDRSRESDRGVSDERSEKSDLNDFALAQPAHHAAHHATLHDDAQESVEGKNISDFADANGCPSHQ